MSAAHCSLYVIFGCKKNDDDIGDSNKIAESEISRIARLNLFLFFADNIDSDRIDGLKSLNMVDLNNFDQRFVNDSV